ncbi:MAG: hypothetical protein JRM86_01655 [Nitrososphaerota archaeon]|jgi:hypothetical protein|nr:hypothetical protein [Nitrososphaerota archaeon]MDG6966480.1 hypothetical protein [Nitrososphaerota archaeon]MDG6978661.1 hypothetical protein [Nitrososphaerota archaeon]MDG7005621.1 hypothetical protein [Nitrososphaerota archaeon]MDG7020405.1 hypothetical protein [Nitrososphaerota archaeon]
MKSLDDEILQLWKDVSPSGAFTCGFEEYAGQLFIPSEENLAKALDRVRALRSRAENELQTKVLDSMEASLSFDEPQPVLDDIVGSIFNHLTKEGVNEKHLQSLVSDAIRAIDVTQKRFSKKAVPSAVKALTLYRLDGVLEVLDAISGQIKGKELRKDCERLREKARRFVALFELKGFGKGTFEEVEAVFKKTKFELGRERFYRVALENGMDYSETPDELEAKAMAWLEDELPRYKDVTKRLARLYKCEATPEAVERHLVERAGLKPRDLLRLTNGMRKVVQQFVDQDVVKINKKYKTKVVETPAYLSGMLPTGAASFFDTFTNKPFQLYFLTTDPKRDPPRSVSQLMDLLVHEEYGHCVNHSNTVLHFGGRAGKLEMVPTLLQAPVTEGLSFNREREFLEASLGLEGKEKLTRAEAAYVAFLERHGGLRLVNAELEFQTRKWRLIRFLRVIGDVRINTGRQTLFEFIDWAHARTGVPKSNVYYQLFPAHEGMFPGYATAYAVVGEEIHAIEDTIKDAKARVRFSTYLTGVGFPPRSRYRKMLQDFAARL